MEEKVKKSPGGGELVFHAYRFWMPLKRGRWKSSLLLNYRTFSVQTDNIDSKRGLAPENELGKLS